MPDVNLTDDAAPGTVEMPGNPHVIRQVTGRDEAEEAETDAPKSWTEENPPRAPEQFFLSEGDVETAYTPDQVPPELFGVTEEEDEEGDAPAIEEIDEADAPEVTETVHLYEDDDGDVTES